MVRSKLPPKTQTVARVSSPGEHQLRYIVLNAFFSFLLFAWFYSSVLYRFVSGTVLPLDASWTNFWEWLWDGIWNFVVMYTGNLVAGTLGSLIAMKVTGYNAFRGGVYGATGLLLGNFVFTVFVYFGLFPILTSLGWFWAIIIYGLLKLGTVGWVEAKAAQAAHATRRGLTKASERIAGVK